MHSVCLGVLTSAGAAPRPPGGAGYPVHHSLSFFHQKNLNFLIHCLSPTLVAELNLRPVQKPRASSCSR